MAAVMFKPVKKSCQRAFHQKSYGNSSVPCRSKFSQMPLASQVLHFAAWPQPIHNLLRIAVRYKHLINGRHAIIAFHSSSSSLSALARLTTKRALAVGVSPSLSAWARHCFAYISSFLRSGKNFSASSSNKA